MQNALLVTVVSSEDEEEQAFWLGASESSLNAIWDHPDEKVYEQLLEG